MYIVNYDISSDKLRNKVATLLEGYGKRVQYSCFECRISAKQFMNLQEKLEKLIKNKEQANVRIYQVCMNCEDKITIYGKSDMEEWSNVYVV